MLNCGGRHFCPGCGEELIHRDHRKSYELASAFGQIVYREGPSLITTGDIDHYCVVHQKNGSPPLVRIIEHKQPSQSIKGHGKGKGGQLGFLCLHAALFELGIKAGIVDSRSGVFILRGKITATTNGKRITYFEGETVVEIVTVEGSLIRIGKLADPEAIYRWLEGTQGTGLPSGPRRKKILPDPARLL